MPINRWQIIRTNPLRNIVKLEIIFFSTTYTNKSSRDEVGYWDSKSSGLMVFGRYKYVTPSGAISTVYYYADVNGYRAKTIHKSINENDATFDINDEVGPLAGLPGLEGGEIEKNGFENEIIPPEVLKSLLG